MKDFSVALSMLLLLCFAMQGNTQIQDGFRPEKEDLSEHILNVGFQRGFLIPHHELMNYLRESNVWGVRASIEKQLKNGWASDYRFISRGIEVYHSSLGNKKILGSVTHAAFYSNFSVHSKGNGRMKIGGGLALLSQKFELEGNFKNVAIGTRTNITFLAEYGYRFSLLKEYELNPFIRFSHYSNAAFKLPNLGLNYASVGLNICWKMNNESLNPNVNSLTTKSYRIDGYSGIGMNEFQGNSNQNYLNLNAGIQLVSLRKTKSLLGFGLDFQYSSGLNELTDLYESTYDFKPINALRFGPSIITGLRFGNTEIHGITGIYIKDFYKLESKIFNRLYVQTNLSNSFKLRLGIKSHLTRAETAEIGLVKTFLTK